MADYNALYHQGLYLSPDQQDLLLAALSSNQPLQKQQSDKQRSQAKTDPDSTPGNMSAGSFSMSPGFNRSHQNSGGLGYGEDESPFLDFNPELDFDFQGSEDLIGDLPGSLPLSEEHESGEKRKDMSDNEENEESGKKRRESDDKAAKKPGRKPLTSEPTSKRKAQNRAAQRAFRERKEKHLKDLETKVDELQKASDDANQENGLLRAHVERLQVELREYRKRLSWLTSGSGISAMTAIPGAHSRSLYGLNNNDFMFDFPKFGDLPGGHIFNGPLTKSNQNRPKEVSSPATSDSNVPGVLTRESLKSSIHHGKAAGGMSNNPSPQVPSVYNIKQSTSSHDTSTSDSPSSSSDSHQSQLLSSNGTSPEPTSTSPATKMNDNVQNHHHHTCTYNTIDGEESFCAQLGMACGNINNPIPAVRSKSESVSNTPSQPSSNSEQPPGPGLDLLAQQNGGQFDPVLFGDWREPQDAILSQDFGTFFDDAFPLPDLGSPSHNFNEVANQQAPKKDLIAEIDNKMDEEVVPGEDKSQMLSCTKIWDRLQSMEKFRNGEIDVDNLCSELRTKARCSEGGVVVNQKDVEDIMGRVK
ncbi:DNA-binding transcription factor yap1 [Aspergillus alliaceus]|uniref:AP-1-like transcription factor YAP1 n=1 Tax=Petromyces alliaceus TaxID=209559 RepID=A0A5N6FKZ8_PETAA|nr:transcription factor PAP1-domain-containing protein [Aspergillus alliaceus]KAB8230642.1 transcription factor PAP1-domain-containing protein [Aspergillus alliaceus]KAE8389214.1 transcription factor PAP1-domain-containing protein [Aspergillus alliaceus]KAF5866666.1 DNA-binding transcription factor yap1 [Aspergillus burnettii]